MSRLTDFDKEEVLQKAMELFWSNGFENTSMNDLMNVTGLKKGSIYNSFGSKEELFLLCLGKYGKNSKARHFKDGDPGEYLKQFFKRLVNQGCDKDYSKGCFIMNSCVEFADDKTKKSKMTETLFSATEQNFKNVITAYFKNTKSSTELKKIHSNVVTAAFSIREISKFKKDKTFLKQIANNALVDFKIRI